jgi:hypothetical protein
VKERYPEPAGGASCAKRAPECALFICPVGSAWYNFWTGGGGCGYELGRRPVFCLQKGD